GRGRGPAARAPAGRPPPPQPPGGPRQREQDRQRREHDALPDQPVLLGRGQDHLAEPGGRPAGGQDVVLLGDPLHERGAELPVAEHVEESVGDALGGADGGDAGPDDRGLVVRPPEVAPVGQGGRRGASAVPSARTSSRPSCSAWAESSCSSSGRKGTRAPATTTTAQWPRVAAAPGAARPTGSTSKARALSAPASAEAPTMLPSA